MRVTATGPKKEPCYIRSAKDEGRKEDYVFGPGPMGFGYYHLLTRASYAALYARMTQESPVPCCFWFMYGKKRRLEFSGYDQVERIVYARSRSSVPIE